MAYGNVLAARQHRQQGALGERAVADLAALRRADAAGLTGGVRREVVVVHVALAVLGVERVDHLLHAQHVQRGDAHDLGLAALEQRRAVHARQHLDLGRQLADVLEAAAVDADLVRHDAAAHDGLGQAAEGGADLLLATLEALGERLLHLRLGGVGGGLALLLAGDAHRGGEVGLAGLGHGGEHVVLVVEEDGEVERLLRRLRLQLELGLADRGDGGLGGLEALGHDVLGRHLAAAGDDLDGLAGGLGLDHHDRDVAVVEQTAGDDHVEGRALELLGGREGDPLAGDAGDAGGADRAGERQARQQHRAGGAVDGEHVVEVGRVERQDRRDDLDLVAQALLEARAQRAVGEAAGEDRVLGRPALTAEERAGDAAHGVHPLLDVDRQREEVEVVLRALGRRGGRQDHRVAEVDRDRAGGLLGEPPGLEADGALRSGTAVVDDSVDELAAVDVALRVGHAGHSSSLRAGPGQGTRCSVEAAGAVRRSGGHSRGPCPRAGRRLVGVAGRVVLRQWAACERTGEHPVRALPCVRSSGADPGAR